MSLCTYGREMRVCVCKSVSVETLTQLPYWSKMPFCRRRISVEIIYVHFPLRRQTRGLLEYLPPPNRMTRKLFGTGACHPDCGKSDWLNCGFAFCQMLNLIFCLLIHLLVWKRITIVFFFSTSSFPEIPNYYIIVLKLRKWVCFHVCKGNSNKTSKGSSI